MRTPRLAGLVAVLTLLPMTAAADQVPSTATDNAAGCLRPRDVDGFIDAHRDHVVLTNGGKHYRASFVNDCIGIEFAFGLAAEAKTSCLSSGDILSFRDNTNLPQRCFIDTLSYVPETKKN